MAVQCCYDFAANNRRSEFLFTAINTVVGSAATIGTLAVAFLVFVEARRIRRAEGIFRQNQAWNDFDNSVLQFHGGSRIGALLMGREDGPDSAVITSADDLTLVEALLLMSLFNVVSSEYHAVRANAIDEKYVMHSLALTHGVLQRNKTWIFGFLEKNGFEASFIRCLRIVERVGTDVDKLAPEIRAEFRSMREPNVLRKLFGRK